MVEGPTEFLLLPLFYQQITGHSIEEDEISIISCNGISYNRYLSIATETEKKIAVITDNDQKQHSIDEAKTFNAANDSQHIFMADSIEEWTWEVCIYKLNNAELDKMIEIQDGADYLFHKKDYGKVLGKMLNNKVDIAYQMLTSRKKFEVPEYVKDAVEWIRK